MRMNNENIDWDSHLDPPEMEHDITYKDNKIYVDGTLTYIITENEEKIDVSFHEAEDEEIRTLLQTEPSNSKNNRKKMNI